MYERMFRQLQGVFLWMRGKLQKRMHQRMLWLR